MGDMPFPPKRILFRRIKGVAPMMIPCPHLFATSSNILGLSNEVLIFFATQPILKLFEVKFEKASNFINES